MSKNNTQPWWMVLPAIVIVGSLDIGSAIFTAPQVIASQTVATTLVEPSLTDKSREYKEGWCAGLIKAVTSVRQNRDHYRRLLGQPEMSQEQVLRWIYSRPWKDEGSHRTAPRRLDQPPGEPEVGPPAIESVDLYVIPGFTDCSVDENGNIKVEVGIDPFR